MYPLRRMVLFFAMSLRVLIVIMGRRVVVLVVLRMFVRLLSVLRPWMSLIRNLLTGFWWGTLLV